MLQTKAFKRSTRLKKVLSEVSQKSSFCLPLNSIGQLFCESQTNYPSSIRARLKSVVLCISLFFCPLVGANDNLKVSEIHCNVSGLYPIDDVLKI